MRSQVAPAATPMNFARMSPSGLFASLAAARAAGFSQKQVGDYIGAQTQRDGFIK